jgi:hypothetical protein
VQHLRRQESIQKQPESYARNSKCRHERLFWYLDISCLPLTFGASHVFWLLSTEHPVLLSQIRTITHSRKHARTMAEKCHTEVVVMPLLWNTKLQDPDKAVWDAIRMNNTMTGAQPGFQRGLWAIRDAPTKAFVTFTGKWLAIWDKGKKGPQR